MRTTDRAFAIDANVILRYLIPDDSELCAKAERILDSVAQGKLTVSCDPVILAEVVFVLTRLYGQSKEQAFTALDPIVRSDYVLIPNKSRYIRALEIYVDTGAHFGDACTCAAALEDCDGRLLSFDRKLSAVDGIKRMESPS